MTQDEIEDIKNDWYKARAAMQDVLSATEVNSPLEAAAERVLQHMDSFDPLLVELKPEKEEPE